MDMKIAFDEVKLSSVKTGFCPVCKKRAMRSGSFSQTHNPFNKNSEGKVKSKTEIKVELIEERDHWLEQPAYHVKCEELSDNATKGTATNG